MFAQGYGKVATPRTAVFVARTRRGETDRRAAVMITIADVFHLMGSSEEKCIEHCECEAAGLCIDMMDCY